MGTHSQMIAGQEKLIVDPNCEYCDKSGTIVMRVTIPCPPDEIPETEDVTERCPNCQAYEDAMNDSILKL